MSDDERFLEEDVAVADNPQPGKKIGILPAFLIKILKWTALGISAIIFIVIVVVFTVNIINANSPKADYLTSSEAYQGKAEAYVYYSNIGEIRGRTSDEMTYMVLVEPTLGYNAKDKALQTELVARTPQLRDLIRQYFSMKTANQLKPANEEGIKAELREMINRILTQGKVREVYFNNLQVIGM